MLGCVMYKSLLSCCLIASLVQGCIVAESRRSPKLELVSQIKTSAYLEEMQRGALAISIIQNVLSLPGIAEGVPKEFIEPLQSVVTAMRYLARPDVTINGEEVFLSAHSEVMMVRASFMDTKQDSSAVYLSRLSLAKAEALADEYLILEKSDTQDRMINLREIFRLFNVKIPTIDNAELSSGGAAYNSGASGVIEVKGRDLVFLLKGKKQRLTFTIGVVERTGTIVHGTIAGQLIDSKTGEVLLEHDWDVETITAKAKSWIVPQFEDAGVGQ